MFPTASSTGFAIPHCRASLGEEEYQAVAAAMRTGWLVHGPKNHEFEEQFTKFLGVPHAVSLNSCTSALYLAVRALGITGEVIMPSFTFMATANATDEAGASPVFAEIHYDTCNLDPEDVERRITSNTEAILPVHFAGQCCDMNALSALAKKHDLALIEDCAETLGSTWDGKQAGHWGVGCYSFFPTKNITTGEGGMLTTRDAKVERMARALAGHGILPGAHAEEKKRWPWFRAASVSGQNMRLTNFQAAMGVVQMRRLPALNAARQERARYYLEHLDQDLFDLPVTAPGASHVYQMFTLKLRKGKRDEFVHGLRKAGIEATVHFDPPVHRQPFYQEYYPTKPLPVTDKVAASILTLPLYPDLTAEQCRTVVEACHKLAKK